MYPRSANIIKYHKNHRSTKSVYNLLQLKEKNPEINLENVRVLYTTGRRREEIWLESFSTSYNYSYYSIIILIIKSLFSNRKLSLCRKMERV